MIVYSSMFSCLWKVDRSALLWIWIEWFFEQSFFLMNFGILNSLYNKEREHSDRSHWRRERCQRWQKRKVLFWLEGLPIPYHPTHHWLVQAVGWGLILFRKATQKPSQSLSSWFCCCCSACPKKAQPKCRDPLSPYSTIPTSCLQEGGREPTTAVNQWPPRASSAATPC